MQQVARSIRQKHNRQRLRHKIQQLTPQEYFNNIRYYHDSSISPHKVLAHQYQHLNHYAFNRNEAITNQHIFSLSEALIYEPMRKNQLKFESDRSKSLMHGNEFLNSYNDKEHRERKEDYFQRLRLIEQAKKQEEQRRIIENKLKSKSVFLPPIKQKSRRTSSKFRSIGIAIYFLQVIRRRFVKFIQARRDFCLKNHKKLIQASAETTKNYYYHHLEKQITQYMILLQNKLKYPNYNLEKNIMSILNSFSQKINDLPVPTTIMQTLNIICCNYSFFPLPYLFNEQLVRIQFSEDFHCTVNMNTDRSCMLAASFILIKLLCYNLFFRPWLVEDLFRKKNEKHVNILSKYEELRKTINRIGSIFYFIAIDNFIFPNPVLYDSKQEIDYLMKDCKLKTIPFLQIIPSQSSKQKKEVDLSSDEQGNDGLTDVDNEQQTQVNGNSDYQDNTHMIVGLNRRFYLKMKQRYKSEMTNIEDNITTWITKVTLSVQEQYGQERKQRTKRLLKP